jgi:esterase/lipase superfamily enzyme
MQRFIDGWHSPSLNKWMDIVTYGHYGFPLLLFPTAAADFLEYERFQLIDAIAQWIDDGKVKVFSINSINNEAWLNRGLHPGAMAWRQVEYNKYICDEVVPYIWNSCRGRFGIITCGASLGAYHAMNQLCRRPDLFAGTIAMSGDYDIRHYMRSDYHDDNVYFNNPVEYVPNLGGEYLQMLQHKGDIFIATGQGAYENPGASRYFSDLLNAKGIPHELSVWGPEWTHDWPTWRAMMRYFIGERY